MFQPPPEQQQKYLKDTNHHTDLVSLSCSSDPPPPAYVPSQKHNRIRTTVKLFRLSQCQACQNDHPICLQYGRRDSTPADKYFPKCFFHACCHSICTAILPNLYPIQKPVVTERLKLLQRCFTPFTKHASASSEPKPLQPNSGKPQTLPQERVFIFSKSS